MPLSRPKMSSSSGSQQTGSKPRDENIFACIKRTTGSFISGRKDVVINNSALEKFASTLRADDLRKEPRTPFPLKFDTLASELEFLGLLNMLNFASGYRELLHQQTKRGAYSTISYGCIGIHISQTINATFLLNLKLIDIPALFGFQTHVDYQLQPGVYSTKKGPLFPLAEQIVRVCNEAGRTMRARGWKGFADFVVTTVKRSHERKSATPAADFVRELGETFPGSFRDVYVDASGAEVCLYKKAQLFARDIHERFGPTDPRFQFEDIDQMTLCADNVLPAVFRHFGILEVSEPLAKSIASRGPLKDKAQECALRAAAIVAGERILALLRRTFSEDEKTGAEKKQQPPSSEPQATAPAAIRVGDTVTIVGLKGSPQYNGASATVVGPLNEGRYAVELAEGKKKINVRVANLRPAVAGTGSTTAGEAKSGCVTPSELDYYLWQVVGKMSQIRAKPRHLCPDTVFY